MHPQVRPSCVSGTTWLLCAILGFTASAEAEAASDAAAYAYFYDANGRQNVVASQTDFCVRVRPPPGKSASERPVWLGPLRSAAPQTTAQARSLSQNIARIEARLAGRGLHVVHGAKAPAVFAGQPDIEWALPILHRPGSDIPIYLTDEIVMRFDPSLSDADRQRTIAAAGCHLVRRDDARPGRCVVRVLDPVTNNPVAVANALHEMPQVRYAHPDFILVRQALNPPGVDDPLYAQQWNLDGDTDKGASPNADINVEAAWSLTEGTPGVRVAIIDDSVESSHPDLVDNYVTGRDYDSPTGFDNDPSPDDLTQQHGTACAGVAVGAANGIGVRGVAPRCGLIGVKFFSSTVSETSDAFYFVMNPLGDPPQSQGASVVSNSWGFTDGSLLPTDLVDAVNTIARDGRNGKGCVVLFAAANSAHTVNGVSALAQLESVMCVGGSTSLAHHAVYSDVGPPLSVVAPTTDGPLESIRQATLSITTADDSQPGWGYDPASDFTGDFGGTSAATPTAAGVCALVLSVNPTLTATQVRAIVEHTAVQIDTNFAQINGVTSHSHRFGYGRVDAAAAVAATSTGERWPAPVKNLTGETAANTIALSWTAPTDDYEAALVVRAVRPFAWRPMDGAAYTVGQEVATGVTVVSNSAVSTYAADGLAQNGYFFGVYSRSTANLYGWGCEYHTFVGATDVFYDNCEGPDPGWVHGGASDSWVRDMPSSYTSSWEQSVQNSGPLPDKNGLRAIGGNQCWGTGMSSSPYSYWPNSAAYLRTPIIDLVDATTPAFLSFYDWCLLETPFDRCTIKVLDDTDAVIGILEDNYGGDYDWTPRVYDLTPYAGRRIRVQFQLLSDDTIQRDGWFIDEIRVQVTPPHDPPEAFDIDAILPVGQARTVALDVRSNDPYTVLDAVITTLPQHGTLSDPNAGAITGVPHTLANHGKAAVYTPDTAYVGGDSFTYKGQDSRAASGDATANLTVIGIAPFPLDEQFESGPPLATVWWARASGCGRVAVTNQYTPAGAFQVILDSSDNTGTCNSLNELTLAVNLQGRTGIRLSYDFKRLNDTADLLPDTWHGATPGDGVSFSDDGVVWYKLDDLIYTQYGSPPPSLQRQVANLDAVFAARGLQYTNAVCIRFQQYGAHSAPYGGITFDNIQIITTVPVASDVHVDTTRDMAVDVTLSASDQDPADVLTYTVTTLPSHGTIADPGAGPITATPYTLASHGRVVNYAPASNYTGSDQFEYHASDGTYVSNEAAVTIVVKPPPVYDADFDNDSDVDLVDFAFFQFCFAGPNTPIRFPECTVTDLDMDNDVDLQDFSVFRMCFNGPNRPPVAPCQSNP